MISIYFQYYCLFLSLYCCSLYPCSLALVIILFDQIIHLRIHRQLLIIQWHLNLKLIIHWCYDAFADRCCGYSCYLNLLWRCFVRCALFHRLLRGLSCWALKTGNLRDHWYCIDLHFFHFSFLLYLYLLDSQINDSFRNHYRLIQSLEIINRLH